MHHREMRIVAKVARLDAVVADAVEWVVAVVVDAVVEWDAVDVARRVVAPAVRAAIKPTLLECKTMLSPHIHLIISRYHQQYHIFVQRRTF
jgi:hypothetical protein